MNVSGQALPSVEELPCAPVVSERVTARELLAMVRRWHHSPGDFWEGDLADRIFLYDSYRLELLPLARIRLNEWAVSDWRVAEYVSRLLGGEHEPPIVFDPVGDSVIDGIHRANARARTNHDSIWAYVGEGERYPTEEEDAGWHE